jgi:hypothetical protein
MTRLQGAKKWITEWASDSVLVLCLFNGALSTYSYLESVGGKQCSKWAGICRCIIPELLYVPEFHTFAYQYIIHPFIFFRYSNSISLFRFKKYTGTCKFPFRGALAVRRFVYLQYCAIILLE